MQPNLLHGGQAAAVLAQEAERAAVDAYEFLASHRDVLSDRYLHLPVAHDLAEIGMDERQYLAADQLRLVLRAEHVDEPRIDVDEAALRMNADRVGRRVCDQRSVREWDASLRRDRHSANSR